MTGWFSTLEIRFQYLGVLACSSGESLDEWSARLPLDLGVARTIPGGRKDKSLLESWVFNARHAI